MLKKSRVILPLMLAALLFAGCGNTPAGNTPSGEAAVSSIAQVEADEEIFVDAVTLEEIDLESEVVALASSPALPKNLMPKASGTKTKATDKATIDYSNTKDGYVMVRYTAKTGKKVKARVTGPSAVDYTYNVPAGEWVTFPLSDGNGSYTVKVLENTTDNKYANICNVQFTAQLTDEFAPFLRPNQYVDYEDAKNTVAQAEKLVGKETDNMKKVQKIYEYVIKNLSYNYDLAKNPPSGYLPDLDSVLKSKKGICFDYASLMTGMLRSQGVPCKLVLGYVPSNGQYVYHAWINVWSEKDGWVNGAVYFNGKTWQRMDPTFASTSNSSDKIMKYIGEGSNYDPRLFY